MSKIDQHEDYLEQWIRDNAAAMLGCKLEQTAMVETNEEYQAGEAPLATSNVVVQVSESDMERISEALDEDYFGFLAPFLMDDVISECWDTSVYIDEAENQITFEITYFT
jgi:hypothetical protein